MKKLLIILLSLCVCLCAIGFFGCSPAPENPESPTQQGQPTPENPTNKTISGVNFEIGNSDFEIIKGMNTENFAVSKNSISFDIDGFYGAVFITESK